MTRDDALRIETQNFVTLTATSAARALVGIFLNDQYVKGKAKKLSGAVSVPQQAAVLGAGIMGGGIAYQSAYKGVPIVMKYSAANHLIPKGKIFDTLKNHTNENYLIPIAVLM